MMGFLRLGSRMIGGEGKGAKGPEHPGVITPPPSERAVWGVRARWEVSEA